MARDTGYYENNAGQHHIARGRAVLHGLLFASSAVLLGLTAYHLHYTRTNLHSYVRTVVELLVTSIIGIILSLWFLTVILRRLAGGANSYGTELGGLTVLWIMSLVGASYISHIWRTLRHVNCIGTLCHIMKAIKAFSWVVFGLTTLLILASLYDRKKNNRATGNSAHGRVTNDHKSGFPTTGNTV